MVGLGSSRSFPGDDNGARSEGRRGTSGTKPRSKPKSKSDSKFDGKFDGKFESRWQTKSAALPSLAPFDGDASSANRGERGDAPGRPDNDGEARPRRRRKRDAARSEAELLTDSAQSVDEDGATEGRRDMGARSREERRASVGAAGGRGARLVHNVKAFAFFPFPFVGHALSHNMEARHTHCAETKTPSRARESRASESQRNESLKRECERRRLSRRSTTESSSPSSGESSGERASFSHTPSPPLFFRRLPGILTSENENEHAGSDRPLSSGHNTLTSSGCPVLSSSTSSSSTSSTSTSSSSSSSSTPAKSSLSPAMTAIPWDGWEKQWGDVLERIFDGRSSGFRCRLCRDNFVDFSSPSHDLLALHFLDRHSHEGTEIFPHFILDNLPDMISVQGETPREVGDKRGESDIERLNLGLMAMAHSITSYILFKRDETFPREKGEGNETDRKHSSQTRPRTSCFVCRARSEPLSADSRLVESLRRQSLCQAISTPKRLREKHAYFRPLATELIYRRLKHQSVEHQSVEHGSLKNWMDDMSSSLAALARALPPDAAHPPQPSHRLRNEKSGKQFNIDSEALTKELRDFLELDSHQRFNAAVLSLPKTIFFLRLPNGKNLSDAKLAPGSRAVEPVPFDQVLSRSVSQTVRTVGSVATHTHQHTANTHTGTHIYSHTDTRSRELTSEGMMTSYRYSRNPFTTAHFSSQLQDPLLG